MPNAYQKMTDAQLDAAIAELERQAADLRALNLKLDMARGKPSPEQTALSRPMLDLLNADSDLSDQGVDADNYGAPDGLPSARALAAELLGVDAANVSVMGSSSLNIMYDCVEHGYVHGIGGERPWCQQGEVKFLCPAPGYDRHFTVTESFGIKNVPVPMREDGPDMDVVREYVEKDATVKGIWCVPKYANPTGITYSDDVVRAFAALKPAAPDFRIFWDNAYAVHTFEGEGDELMNIFDALAEQGGEKNLVYEFASTAKVTFPSSGMAWVTASPADMAELRRAFAAMRVSPEKISQLAHVRFLKDAAGVAEHMKRHAALVAPRFALVEEKLASGLGELECATWTHPKGGYFVSFEGPEGSAKAIVSLAKELGVTLTPAGAPWPYGNDPRDTNIRIAPTYPTLDELGQALDVFVVAVKLVSARLARSERG
ncbi:aminotransferase class I/II-fold pyridoxal phosphate-dependent enzyme [Thermophilibacter provencensis]|uniref:Aminotransferase class I/II-fold pyridoxal phosphate-dependent enzyme n=1 Tax=Thermophilibacter provencensis TaxID=1852386 RepID=A0A921GG71_9ACTN|nr:aminotransferase class I/II-fold pyridoxal phosphate-dependent enzyme [Thermophilibacter provencensis]HJF45314.1 aminotransferase class I/II-fold pyridoxal phosphate-dependent enzyme [Thermophilibacter provencensis]